MNEKVLSKFPDMNSTNIPNNYSTFREGAVIIGGTLISQISQHCINTGIKMYGLGIRRIFTIFDNLKIKRWSL